MYIIYLDHKYLTLSTPTKLYLRLANLLLKRCRFCRPIVHYSSRTWVLCSSADRGEMDVKALFIDVESIGAGKYDSEACKYGTSVYIWVMREADVGEVFGSTCMRQVDS